MSPTLRRARVLAALRELDVAIDFGWRPFAAFCGRPYDQAIDDLPTRVESRQNGAQRVREAS